MSSLNEVCPILFQTFLPANDLVFKRVCLGKAKPRSSKRLLYKFASSFSRERVFLGSWDLGVGVF